MNNNEIKEYRDILKEELSKGENMDSSIKVLTAKRNLLETNNPEILEVLSSLEGKSIEDAISSLDNYLKDNNVSTSKGFSKTLNNPSFKNAVFSSESDTGFSNIILLSITLIVIVIIIFAIILV